jgi:hypothetical protein
MPHLILHLKGRYGVITDSMDQKSAVKGQEKGNERKAKKSRMEVVYWRNNIQRKVDKRKGSRDGREEKEKDLSGAKEEVGAKKKRNKTEDVVCE